MILQSIYDFWCFYFGEAATWIGSIVGLFYAGYRFRKYVEQQFGSFNNFLADFMGLKINKEEHK